MSRDEPKLHAAGGPRATRAPLAAPDVDALWGRIDQGLTRRRARRRLWVRAAPLVVATLAIVLIVSLRLHGRSASGPLALSAGALPTALAADPARPETDVRFADGSDVRMAQGALVEVMENTGDRFVTALRSGGATFDVRPGGPRRWVVESGHVRVEVVGTRFVVERRAGVVRVTVMHGVVVVRGDRVPDGVQRLGAGDSLDVPEEGAVTPGPPASAAAPSKPSEVPSAPSAPSPEAHASASAVAPTPPPSATVAADPIGDALREAEAAERAGDAERAIARLRVVVAGGGRDARSAVAAFSLARLLLPSRPAEAAQVLAGALARGMPRALEEHARARLVEAYARSGQASAAAAAAADYLARYPEGAHRAEVERWSPPR